jgi:hypothetical protein
MEVSMQTLRKLLAGPLVLVTVMSSNAFAQQRHVVDPAAIANAITQRVVQDGQTEDAARAAVREALERPEVRDVASKIGIHLDRLTGAVATLDGDDAASSARQVNDTLTGGASTIVISTTTVIIALLLLLLIIVAVD